MLHSAATRTVFDLAVQDLKEEHAACVRRISRMVAEPNSSEAVQGYLLRIENINRALVRLAGSRVAH